MFILDTDHVSLFQRHDPHVSARVLATPPQELATTVITVEAVPRHQKIPNGRVWATVDTGVLSVCVAVGGGDTEAVPRWRASHCSVTCQAYCAWAGCLQLKTWRLLAITTSSTSRPRAARRAARRLDSSTGALRSRDCRTTLGAREYPR